LGASATTREAEVIRGMPASAKAVTILVLQVACFWPVWQWFVARLTDGSDEPWGIAALGAGIVCSWPRDRRFRIDAEDPLLTAAALLTCTYVVLSFVAPPIVRAIAALAAIGCLWVAVSGARKRVALVVALFLLSLPLIASLQFYLGYPLRAATAAGATGGLRLCGFDVARVGTAMTWAGRTILVDAPCSGVRMLWTGAFLACVLAAQRPQVTLRDLALVLVPVVPVVLGANVLRAAALFVAETQSASLSAVAHSAIGVAAFAFVACALVFVESLTHSVAVGCRLQPESRNVDCPPAEHERPDSSVAGKLSSGSALQPTVYSLQPRRRRSRSSGARSTPRVLPR
jgi:exosortase